MPQGGSEDKIINEYREKKIDKTKNSSSGSIKKDENARSGLEYLQIVGSVEIWERKCKEGSLGFAVSYMPLPSIHQDQRNDLGLSGPSAWPRTTILLFCCCEL